MTNAVEASWVPESCKPSQITEGLNALLSAIGVKRPRALDHHRPARG